MNLEFLKSPWVIGGGLAIGALILLMGRSGGTASSADPNRASSLDLIALQSQTAADVEKTRITAGAALGAQVADTIGNLVNATYAHDLGAKQVAAGVRTTQIAANTALGLERLNVKTRAYEIGAGMAIAHDGNITQLKGQTEQDKTAIKLQADKESASFNNTIAGIIGKLL